MFRVPREVLLIASTGIQLQDPPVMKTLQDVFVHACLLQGQTVSLSNVAQSGTASQSSTYSSAEAWRAIDGNKNSVFIFGSCTHTMPNRTQWWSLLLPAVYRIRSVSITNRFLNADRINNALILVGSSQENNGNNNPKCAVIPSIPGGATQTFTCGGMIGRLVNLYRTGPDPEGILTICELELDAEVIDPAPSVSAVVGGRNITVVQSKLCWSDALFYCRDFYWDLLSVRSEGEQRELEQVLGNISFPLTRYVWLGLRRYLMGGTWFWMTGESEDYRYWKTPSVWQETSPCGGMDTGGHHHWGDAPCGDHLHFICLTDIQKDKKTVEFYSSARP